MLGFYVDRIGRDRNVLCDNGNVLRVDSDVPRVDSNVLRVDVDVVRVDVNVLLGTGKYIRVVADPSGMVGMIRCLL